MDYSFVTQRGNDAFPEMLRDNVWQWVKPTEFIDTNWSDPDGDGQDRSLQNRFCQRTLAFLWLFDALGSRLFASKGRRR
jgi:hypothetical protein